MSDYGVTPTGFVKKPLEVIRQEIKDDLLGEIDPTLNLLDSAVFGQIIGVFSDKLREMWEVAEAVYRAFYPDSASDEALDGVSSITGVIRQQATQSPVTLDQLYLDDGTTITVDSEVSVGPTGPRFVITEEVSNSSGATATFSAAALSKDYGPISGNAGTIDTIQTPIGGWNAKAAVSGTETENFSLDGTSLVLEVDENGDSQTVNFAAGDPWSAADAATEIENDTTDIDSYDDGIGRVRIGSETEGTGSSIRVVSGSAMAVLGLTAGLTKGFNSEDATAGRNLETDPDFRIRRENSLRSTGSATVEAIYAALILVQDVEQVIVLENVDDFVSPEGLPPHSFEAIVYQTPEDEQAIADAIWDKKPAGIKPVGNTPVTITDSMGFDHTFGYSKPTEVPLTLVYTLTVDSDLYPVDGDDQVKAAVVAFTLTLNMGEDVIALQFKAIPLDITGVIDVTAFTINGGTVNIPLTPRQIATADTGDITVNS